MSSAHPTACWSAEVGGIRLRFGPGVLAEGGEVARELGGQRAWVVTDPGVRAAGYPARLVESLIQAGLVAEIFDVVGENPTTAQVEAGAARAAEFQPDLLVAIGGGSALDTAKAVNFLLTNGGRMEDYWGFGKASRPMLPSLALPTTAGTGSDAQSYTVIARATPEPGLAHGRKMACGDRKARFSRVLLDPDLLDSLPRRVISATGMDALSHAVECAVTLKRTPVSLLYAREAWRLLDRAFALLLADASRFEARADMLLGAHLAGAAIEASMLGAAHAAANPLTAAYGILHGSAVGLMLPAVVRRNSQEPAIDALYRELVPGGGAELASRLEFLRSEAGLPDRLSACGVEQHRLGELAGHAVKEWTGTFNPVAMDQGAFEEIYAAAF